MRNVFWLVLLTVPALARGQSPEAVGQPAGFRATGAFFALSVADADASAKWYAEKLGLKLTMQVAKSNETPAVRILAGGGLIVELIDTDKAVPLSKAAPGIASEELVHGIFKVGVVVDDLDEILALLKAKAVPTFLGPFPARENSMRNLIIKDNSGNLIQFFGRK